MSLNYSQRAMIYLIAKGMRQQDFALFMQISPQRASYMLKWYDKNFKWHADTVKRIKEHTNGGLDVDSPIWQQIGDLLKDLPVPLLTCKVVKSLKKKKKEVILSK